VFVRQIAREESLPDEALLIGGDQLGPLIWANLPAETAMEHVKQLMRDCALAGYAKIYLDTSMRLGEDDPGIRLMDKTFARRGALLSNG
jgi:D-tagatose-1,6-bisphosphate aldolase subunit GatZ/KbaZ